MPAPVIRKLPTPPNRQNAPAVFAERADAFLGSFPNLADDMNASAAFVDERAVEAEEAAQTSVSARNAAQQAVANAEIKGAAQVQLAKQEVQLAAGHAEDAAESAQGAAQSHIEAMSAAAAAASGAGLPSLIGNRGKPLIVNDTETGVLFGDALKLSTQAQATQGTDNTTAMTPLRTKQAIDTMAIAPMFGVGQEWTPVTRQAGVSYQNVTGKPILVSASISRSNTISMGTIAVSSDNATWRTVSQDISESQLALAFVQALVPPNAYYRINPLSGLSIQSVVELR